MKVYGKQQGFGIIRKRLELHEDGNIKHRGFRCEFGGHYQPKKQVNIHNHHNRKSKRQGCEWHANVNCPKNICQITLTTLNDTHNHPLHLNTEKYASIHRTIPEDILNEIQFFTEHGSLSIGTQRKLLKAKFPTASILDCDLTNAIRKFKVRHDEKQNAARLLTTLINRKSHNSEWVVEFELDNENRLTRLFWMSPEQVILWLEYHDVILNDNTAKTNRYQMPLSLFLIVDNNTKSRLVAQALVSDETTESYKWILECTKKATMTEPLVFVTDADPAADAAIAQIYEATYPIHCIFHISENLPKNLKSKLHEQYESFVHDFFLCRNSLCQENFNERWSQLIENYSNVKDYLMRALYPSRQAWARAFTSKTFTARIQTTSRVEGLNNIIKRMLAANSTLCDLADVLDSRLQAEAERTRFFEYQTLSNCMGITSVGHDLFPEIDKQMTQYLTPHILSAEHLEMSQCLFFIASQVQLDINNTDEVN